MYDTTPAFNLKAVLRETGLSADALRAWERRYGLPRPQRSAGGHRLYSERDIATIKWLMARQRDGLSISRAVELWNEQLAAGKDPLAAPLPSPAPGTAPSTNLDRLRAQWLTACLNFDERQAEQILNLAFSLYDVEAVCKDILQKGIAEIGELWYQNRATVQQEHFASALALRRLDSLLAASPPAVRPQTLLLGCPSNEWHTFTVLLLALLLRRRGWNVIYLGANVPVLQFQETIALTRAQLVILVAQQLTTAASLYETAHHLASHHIRVAFGGRIFNIHPSLTRRIPGHYLGSTMDEAFQQIETLILTNSPPRQPEPVEEEFGIALSWFQSHRPQIEATFHQHIQNLGLSHIDLLAKIEFFGNNIAAALQLGDMSLIDHELDWLQSLLEANHVPASTLSRFLQAYAHAVDLHINGSGKPILDWIERFKGEP